MDNETAAYLLFLLIIALMFFVIGGCVGSSVIDNKVKEELCQHINISVDSYLKCKEQDTFEIIKTINQED